MAFLRQDVWKQADLARECELSTRALRDRIRDLTLAGVDIEREEDWPHVYYSVPKGWFPGQTAKIDRLDYAVVARLISRLPKSAERERILRRFITPAFGPASVTSDAVPDVTDEVLATLERAAARRVALRAGYYTASRGEPGIRLLSVQRIEYGPRTRFIAHCHTTHALKWFRADRLTTPTLDTHASFVAAPKAELDRFVAESLDGYRSSAGAVPCEFVVRGPESHWILRNLPHGAAPVVEHRDGEVHVVLRTSAFDVLARYLVGLGGAVRAIAPRALRQRVQTIARESLLAHEARLNIGTERRIRRTR